MSKNPEVSSANTEPERGSETLASGTPRAFAEDTLELLRKLEGSANRALETAILNGDIEAVRSRLAKLPGPDRSVSLQTLIAIKKKSGDAYLREFVSYMCLLGELHALLSRDLDRVQATTAALQAAAGPGHPITAVRRVRLGNRRSSRIAKLHP